MTERKTPLRIRFKEGVNMLFNLARARGFFAFCGLALAGPACALKDRQALTPPMGWNSWNHFGAGLTEAKFKAIADAFVTTGLKDAGYSFLVIDDGWMQSARDAAGNLVPVPSKYPNGLQALGDYVHAKGLKFGIYECPTKTTCERLPGSFGHEAQDARAFASWGADFLKYDWCGVQSGEDAQGLTVAQVQGRFATMRDALKATSRPFIYAMSEKGQGTKGVVPGTWSDSVAHMWRIGHDIGPNWGSVTGHADENAGLAKYAGPGGWNDPDMLEVGNGTLTTPENRTHFSLWCIQAAPLILGNDPSSMTDVVKAILTNKEAIAIDQDSLGIQGERIKGKGALEVWVKGLKNGDKGVLLVNRTATAGSISVQWNDSLIKWSANAAADVRDIWNGKDYPGAAKGFSAQVASHDAVLIRVHNPNATGIRSRNQPAGEQPLGKVIAGRDGQPGFYLAGGSPGNAEVTDVRGNAVLRFPVAAGWNRVPAALAPGTYSIRVTGTPAGISRRFFVP